MAYEFGSDAWAQAMCRALNASPTYREAAATWEGDFYFICNPGPDVPEAVTIYFDLWRGACRAACVVADPAGRTPAFELSGDLDSWKKVLDGTLDPIKGIITRQLKLKGNMVKVLQAPRAAMEMVKCATMVDTVWPV